jgi:hypothetical protein
LPNENSRLSFQTTQRKKWRPQKGLVLRLQKNLKGIDGSFKNKILKNTAILILRLFTAMWNAINRKPWVATIKRRNTRHGFDL